MNNPLHTTVSSKSTRQLLCMIPQSIQPGDDIIDTRRLRARLSNLDRQALVLHFAEWFYENQDVVGKISFQVGRGRTSPLLGDQVVHLDQSLDPAQIQCAIEHLDEVLRFDLINELGTDAARLLVKLNEIKWTTPAAWDVLVSHLPVVRGLDNQKWLDGHRAAWEASLLEDATPALTQETAQNKRRL